ncbi:endo-1,4-beta-xylanase [Coleofasciculus sp. FACHB-1120]|uniref:endo-1,4-beta-xylanase n=1 Tax=Coleofasciculus sp. FACHB-1120 TaxID=2692783 RepID=UPI0016846A4B|nr:endo-1,4-beta-xylanase [Coleofasciculus sp. FACHB-1120]MBD2744008.1 endo-1,4-beta-xylanase [Coleofasciculus sp. FACHB-1120]
MCPSIGSVGFKHETPIFISFNACDGYSLMLLIGQGAITKPANTPNISLRSLAGTRGIGIGMAVAMQSLSHDSTYREVVVREFNLIVAENRMKF